MKFMKVGFQTKRHGRWPNRQGPRGKVARSKVKRSCTDNKPDPSVINLEGKEVLLQVSGMTEPEGVTFRITCYRSQRGLLHHIDSGYDSEEAAGPKAGERQSDHPSDERTQQRSTLFLTPFGISLQPRSAPELSAIWAGRDGKACTIPENGDDAADDLRRVDPFRRPLARIALHVQVLAVQAVNAMTNEQMVLPEDNDITSVKCAWLPKFEVVAFLERWAHAPRDHAQVHDTL